MSVEGLLVAAVQPVVARAAAQQVGAAAAAADGVVEAVAAQGVVAGPAGQHQALAGAGRVVAADDGGGRQGREADAAERDQQSRTGGIAGGAVGVIVDAGVGAGQLGLQVAEGAEGIAAQAGWQQGLQVEAVAAGGGEIADREVLGVAVRSVLQPEGIGAGAAAGPDLVRAVLEHQQVVAVAAEHLHDVYGLAAAAVHDRDQVVADAAVEGVVASPALQDIVAGAAAQQVVAGGRDGKRIVAVSAIQQVIAGTIE